MLKGLNSHVYRDCPETLSQQILDNRSREIGRIGRLRSFGIDAASILRAPTPLAPGGASATTFRYRSAR